MAKDKIVTFLVSADLDAKIKQAAANEKKPVSVLLRELCEEIFRDVVPADKILS